VKKTCVIGWPIAHSRSPIIHGYWIQKHGLDATYVKKAIEPEHLAAFLLTLDSDGFVGCNVTLPYKEAAFRLVDETDTLASRLGAVNTIYIKDCRLIGTNTDGEGFLNSLSAAYPKVDLAGLLVVILGAGGSARAVIGALLDAGVREVAVANRSGSRIAELNTLFGSRVRATNSADMENCDLLIHTTPQGMEGQPPFSLDLSQLKASCVVADLIYTPLKTELLAAAEARGHRILPGLGMLLHQAVRGFEIWHGIRPEVTKELHDLVAADIGRVPAT
jgi:shikimate dehydrogenase